MQLKPTYQAIWQIAYPIMLGMLGYTIINVTDTAFVSRLGEAHLGASALGGILLFILIFIAGGFATGLQVLAARREGEAKPREVGLLLDQTLYLMLAFLLVFMAGLLWGLEPLLNLTTRNAQVRALTLEYVHVRMYELPAGMLFWVLRAYYAGVGRTKVLITATLVMTSLNVLLNYGLVFGRLGLPELGLRGSALASVISETLGVSVAVLYLFTGGFVQRNRLFRFRRPSWAFMTPLAQIGAPMALQNFMSSGAYLAFFLVFEHMGERALAAANLVRSLYFLTIIPVIGIGQATNTVVSNVLGQGRPDWIAPALRRAIYLGLAFMVVTGGILLIWGQLILRLYGQADQQALRAVSLPMLPIVALALVLSALGYTLLNALIGTGAARRAFLAEAITIAVYVLGLVLLGSYSVMPHIAWWAEVQYWATMAVLAWLMLRSKMTKKEPAQLTENQPDAKVLTIT